MAEGSAGPVLVVIPTYNERDNLEPLLTRLHAAVPGGRRAGRRRRQPGRHRRAGRQAGRRRPARARAAPHRARPGSAPRTWPGSPSRCRASTRSSSRWTPTAATPPRTCRRCSPRSTARTARTSSSAPATCPGGQVLNWPAHRNWISRTGNLYSRLALGVRSATSPAGTACSAASVLEALTLDEVESQGYCFQIDLAWRALQAGFRVRRGADHVHRAGARRVEDEQRDRRRGAVEGHAVGGGAALAAAPQAGRAGRQRHLTRRRAGPPVARPSVSFSLAVTACPKDDPPPRRSRLQRLLEARSGDLGAPLGEQLEALAEQHLQVARPCGAPGACPSACAAA